MKKVISCLIVVIPVVFLLLSACSNGGSPEEQVRRYIKAGEEAAEARDVTIIKKLIAEKYSDDHGRTRRDLVAITARYFFTNKNIHIFSRIGELVFPEENRARLQLFVAMTGQNVSDLDALLNMRADLYRFDMDLALEDKEWKLISAEWRQAGPEDFF